MRQPSFLSEKYAQGLQMPRKCANNALEIFVWNERCCTMSGQVFAARRGVSIARVSKCTNVFFNGKFVVVTPRATAIVW
jgi:hypothetical protein